MPTSDHAKRETVQILAPRWVRGEARSNGDVITLRNLEEYDPASVGGSITFDVMRARDTRTILEFATKWGLFTRKEEAGVIRQRESVFEDLHWQLAELFVAYHGLRWDEPTLYRRETEPGAIPASVPALLSELSLDMFGVEMEDYTRMIKANHPLIGRSADDVSHGWRAEVAEGVTENIERTTTAILNQHQVDVSVVSHERTFQLALRPRGLIGWLGLDIVQLFRSGRTFPRCAACGTYFAPHDKRMRFCSERCASRHRQRARRERQRNASAVNERAKQS